MPCRRRRRKWRGGEWGTGLGGGWIGSGTGYSFDGGIIFAFTGGGIGGGGVGPIGDPLFGPFGPPDPCAEDTDGSLAAEGLCGSGTGPGGGSGGGARSGGHPNSLCASIAGKGGQLSQGGNTYTFDSNGSLIGYSTILNAGSVLAGTDYTVPANTRIGIGLTGNNTITISAAAPPGMTSNVDSRTRRKQ